MRLAVLLRDDLVLVVQLAQLAVDAEQLVLLGLQDGQLLCSTRSQKGVRFLRGLLEA